MITEEGGKTTWLEWVSEKPQIQKQQVQTLVKQDLENHTPSGAHLICLNCKAILHKKVLYERRFSVKNSLGFYSIKCV